MKCVAYIRVSTERQAEEGHGLESQKRDIDEYARKNNLIIEDYYIDDGYTGAVMERPELKRLMNDCFKKRIKTIISYKLDRISRDMVDALYLIEKVFIPSGAEVKCVHDVISYSTPMEQAYTQMMAVFAQLDKNTMLLRMRGGMLERVKAGFWKGGGNPPYAYRYSKDLGILVPIEERAETCRQALDMYLQGNSIETIAKICRIQEQTIRNILFSETNVGYIKFKGEIYKGLHEPIFDKEKYDRAIVLRNSRKRNKIRTEGTKYLLSGLVCCGVCGCKMRYIKGGKIKQTITCYSRYPDKYYLPNHNKKCDNEIHDAVIVEKEVEKQILQLSLTLSGQEQTDNSCKEKILKKQLSKTRTKLKRLYELYADGNDMIIDMIKSTENEIEEINAEIEKEISKEEDSSKKIIFDKIKSLSDIWDKISVNEKNKILKLIIKKIVLTNGDIEIQLKKF